MKIAPFLVRVKNVANIDLTGILASHHAGTNGFVVVVQNEIFVCKLRPKDEFIRAQCTKNQQKNTLFHSEILVQNFCVNLNARIFGCEFY